MESYFFCVCFRRTQQYGNEQIVILHLQPTRHVSEELSSMEINRISCQSCHHCNVSEELSSMEIRYALIFHICENIRFRRTQQYGNRGRLAYIDDAEILFQKNLVVWKFTLVVQKTLILYSPVSEELSSMEIYITRR